VFLEAPNSAASSASGESLAPGARAPVAIISLICRIAASVKGADIESLEFE
jgi:hypothetical protein